MISFLLQKDLITKINLFKKINQKVEIKMKFEVVILILSLSIVFGQKPCSSPVQWEARLYGLFFIIFAYLTHF